MVIEQKLHYFKDLSTNYMHDKFEAQIYQFIGNELEMNTKLQEKKNTSQTA